MGWAAAQVGGWVRHVEKPPRGAASQTSHVDSRSTLPGATQLSSVAQAILPVPLVATCSESRKTWKQRERVL